MRLSVTARIALLSIALALVTNLALAAFVWHQTDGDAIAAVRRETIEKSDAMREVWETGGLPAVRDAVGEARAPGDLSLLLAVVDAHGRRVAGYAPAHVSLPLRPTAFRIADIDESERTLDAGYALQPIGGNWLLVGRALDLVEAQQRAIERALAIAVVLSLGLGAGAAGILARYVTGRLDVLAGVIDAAGEGNLSRRVDTSAGGDDAFDRLAGRLNAMLGKVERLMGELRVVTDSLAHDLRSPLARLRSKTEAAVMTEDPAQREAALASLTIETDLIMRMLSTLIEISRAETVSRDRFVMLAPQILVAEIGELYAPVLEDAGIGFDLAIDAHAAPMPIHRELMSQALSNLIDNAIRHAAASRVIVLRMARVAGGTAIQVEDRGPGIAEADRAQALRRFGRLDDARSLPGAGLGMALIEAVARLHGGRFELDDNRPGLIARIVLPD